MRSRSHCLAAGCGGGDGGGETTVAVPCNDAAFRAQDEELYVTKAAVSNASGGGGAPATLLLDLQRARRALGGYLAAHPPCADDLRDIAATEQTALDELDAAIAALEDEQDAAAAPDQGARVAASRRRARCSQDNRL